jgi:hypothetical protein
MSDAVEAARRDLLPRLRDLPSPPLPQEPPK